IIRTMLRICGHALVFTLLLHGQAPGPSKPSLRERATGGDAEAQFNLAKLYEAGRSGLKKDYAEAAKWYRLSSEQGDPYAQASLGILHRFGKGVEQSNVKAYFWFSLAVLQTSGGERESIREMRDAAASKLSRAELEESNRLVREWKAKSSQ
ncbi:MAG: tetratricopeptide repeat protein, partial [Bryobacteraceae bacterium]